MQRMDHHHKASLFGCSIDLAQPRIAERDTIDMSADLDATQAERADFLQPPGRARRILHRHHADADKMPGVCAAQLRDPFVDMPAERIRVIGWKPVRQQLRHR